MDITILINWLNSSKLQSTNNSLYQTIKALIDQANVTNTEVTAIKNSGGGSSGNSGTVTTTGTPVSGNLAQFTGTTSIGPGNLSGDVSTTGTLVVAIGANKVTDTMFRQSAALSVVGRSANSTGNVADISSSSDEQILGRRSNIVGWNLIQSFGYWSPLTTGGATPELIFDSFGDVIMVWTAL